MQKHTVSTTRLACIVAVLLASSAWQCLAEEHATTDAEATPIKRVKTPRWKTPTYSAENVPETLRLAETAQRLVVLAEMANNLANNASKQLQKLRARAETAVNATTSAAANAEKIAKSKATYAAQRAAQDAQMAAQIAQELYGNATASPTLIDDHAQWYKERHDGAKKLLPTLAAAVDALEKNENKQSGDMTQLVGAVLGPARSIFKLAQDAENDAKYIARMHVNTELLAEKMEIMRDLAKRAVNETARNGDLDTMQPCKNTDHQESSTAAAPQRRQAAAKAYLYAALAQKVADKCSSRIHANATKVKEMYYSIKQLLAKVSKAEYKALRVYHGIADEAHTNAEDSKRVAESTSENAAMYMSEARSARDSIASCASNEAQWHITMARRASHKALNEAHLAMYQLFIATLSLQQMADATSAVMGNSQGTETDNSITGPKEKAIDSEKAAETSYTRVKAYADEAADKLHRAEETVKQIRRLMAQNGDKSATATIEEHLQTAKTAVRVARASAKQAQNAASSAHAHYDDAKAAADSALGAFAQKDVTKFETAAKEFATAAQESENINASKARRALEEVTRQEQKATEAYKEAKQAVAEAHKAKQRKE